MKKVKDKRYKKISNKLYYYVDYPLAGFKIEKCYKVKCNNKINYLKCRDLYRIPLNHSLGPYWLKNQVCTINDKFKKTIFDNFLDARYEKIRREKYWNCEKIGSMLEKIKETIEEMKKND